ncbi:energy transducer TonB [Saccharicrinis aurantiacus]|uniref:energy transducer TonB n=1 Tax=Saccharicrinis aurantiacus TaxID=1849719 RepID=UPI00248F555F|nr:energy transducer TonB [Saccharicrinis aurantiacus]
MLPKKYEHANLEHKKIAFVELGFIVSLAIVLFSLELNISPKSKNLQIVNEVIYLEEEMIPITKQLTPKPPEIPKVINTSDILNIVADDVEIDVELEIVDSEINEDDDVEYTTNWEIEEEEEVVEAPIFIVVEEMPIFRPDICDTPDEGKLELMKYVANEVRYPVVAAETGITGRVYVSFVVSEQGNVTNVEVVRGVHPALDKEALRVIESLPKFSSGKQRGKPVRVQYNVPINFVLR